LAALPTALGILSLTLSHLPAPITSFIIQLCKRNDHANGQDYACSAGSLLTPPQGLRVSTLPSPINQKHWSDTRVCRARASSQPFHPSSAELCITVVSSRPVSQQLGVRLSSRTAARADFRSQAWHPPDMPCIGAVRPPTTGAAPTSGRTHCRCRWAAGCGRTRLVPNVTKLAVTSIKPANHHFLSRTRPAPVPAWGSDLACSYPRNRASPMAACAGLVKRSRGGRPPWPSLPWASDEPTTYEVARDLSAYRLVRTHSVLVRAVQDSRSVQPR